MANGQSSGLRRDIGFFGAAFLVLNAMIGAGIFALPGKVAVNAGLLSPWLFLVVGVLFLSIVLTFAELASYYDKTGGPVIYATDAFGSLAGFSTGWVIYLARMTAFAANATVMATYLASLSDVFAGLRPSPGGRFAGLEVEESEWGPVLADFQTRAYCTMLDSDEETFSVMVEGSIDKIELGELDDPLVYFCGRYRPLG